MNQRSKAKLTEKDLYFVIQTVATERQDYEHIAQIVRDKPDFLDLMLDDDKLFNRVMDDEEILLEISPHLLFEILLRRAHRELERQSYTVEKIGITQRVPVFDGNRVVELLCNKAVRDYLVDTLSSFTRTESIPIYFKVGRRFYRRTYSDMDIDSVIELCGAVEKESRFAFFKRIGDIALFLTGVFPEYIESSYRYPLSLERRPRVAGKKHRSLEEYEEEGRKFYRLAAEHEDAKVANLEDVLFELSQDFTLARKPLEFISHKYLRLSKLKWFAPLNF